MKNLISVFAFTLLLTSGICDDPANVTSTTSSPTTTESTTLSVDTTTLASTTAKVDTTTLPSTTQKDTTRVPVTTSTSPTPVPTTTPSTTTEKSTTQMPTTMAPIPTTPEPPSPVMGEWNVTDGNVTCIRADLKIRFKIPVGDKFEYIVLSPNATNDGSSCNSTNGTQVLSLLDSDYSLTFTFDKDGNTKTYVKEIKFSCKLPDRDVNVVSEAPLFSVQSGNSYLCNTGNVDLQNVTMQIQHIQLQSFGRESNLSFGLTEECEADNKVDDLVPIVVGCALLALVVFVLVAYFVGRRRSRQKGYQSV